MTVYACFFIGGFGFGLAGATAVIHWAAHRRLKVARRELAAAFNALLSPLPADGTIVVVDAFRGDATQRGTN